MRSFINYGLNGKRLLYLFIFTSCIYLIMMFITIPNILKYSGGMQIFDLMPNGYSFNYAQDLLTKLGEKGRNTYLYLQIPLDFIYPLSFGITYSLIIAFLLKKIDCLDKKVFYLSFLPIIAALFDYCENIGIILMLKSFPSIYLPYYEFSNFSTIIKSYTSILSFFTILILLLILIFLLLTKSPKTNK